MAVDLVSEYVDTTSNYVCLAGLGLVRGGRSQGVAMCTCAEMRGIGRMQYESSRVEASRGMPLRIHCTGERGIDLRPN